MDEDDLAYDGSNNPPKRELTARERDILCRVLTDIIQHGIKDPPTFMPNGDDVIPLPHWHWSPTSISIGEGGFLGVLWEIRKVMNPRDERHG